MTLQDVMRAIDVLSPDELRQLRIYIEQRTSAYASGHESTTEERIQRLDAAAAAIREGLTEVERDEMTKAMNAEYIEPFDEEQWKD